MKDDMFRRVSEAALPRLPQILNRIGVGHRLAHGELQMLNPLRADRHYGSFSINLHTGRWADFATGDRGGDVVSLVAYLQGCSQFNAARDLAGMLGVPANE